MMTLLLAVLVAGAAGSPHCAGMCGGMVAFATGGAPGQVRGRLGALAAYNAVRGLGYTTLGLLAGALGSTLNGAGVRLGIGRVAGVVAGAVMIGWGAGKLLAAFGVRLPKARRASRIDVPIARVMSGLRERRPAVRAGIVGGCTAALPCGLLHASTVVAAGTGNALQGALVMLAFWMGTLPALLGVGLGAQFLSGRLRRHADLVGALALVVLGLSSVTGRLRAPIPSGISGDPGDPSGLSTLNHPKCCHGH